MVLNEACQLWIDQEIEAGQEAGKNHNKIGVEISEQILKHFETKVSSDTIAQKSRRKAEKENLTNVRNDKKKAKKQEDAPPKNLSNDPETIKKFQQQVSKMESPQLNILSCIMDHWNGERGDLSVRIFRKTYSGTDNLLSKTKKVISETFQVKSLADLDYDCWLFTEFPSTIQKPWLKGQPKPGILIRKKTRAEKNNEKLHQNTPPKQPRKKKVDEDQELYDDVSRRIDEQKEADAMARAENQAIKPVQVTTMETALELFGLAKHTSWIRLDTLKIIYKGFSKKFHPDTNGNAGDPNAADMMVQLNIAMELLMKVTK